MVTKVTSNVRQATTKAGGVLAAAIGLGLCASLPAHALTYNFSWTSNNALNSAAFDEPITATGTLDINVGAGESFTEADISNVNISVQKGAQSATFISFTSALGSISVDGLSASFSPDGDAYLEDGNTDSAFGCATFNCDDGQIQIKFGPLFYGASYNTQEDALASMNMTAAAVPVPFAFNPAFGFVSLAAGSGISKLRRRFQAKRAAQV